MFSCLEDALAHLHHRQAGRQLLTVDDFISVLHLCRKRKDIASAKRVHKLIKKQDLETHGVLGNYLVPTLAECGSLCDAEELFQRLLHRNEHSWTSLIHLSVEYGDFDHAFNLFQKMQKERVQPSRYTLQAMIKACTKLKSEERGQYIHAEIAKEGFEQDMLVGSTLVDMYIKCGVLAEARDVFDELRLRDVVSWTALIGGYADQGLVDEGLNCLRQMKLEGVSPNAVTYVCSLKACGNSRSVRKGQDLHEEIVKVGLDIDQFVAIGLVDTYAKCGLLAEAQGVFDGLVVRDIVAWTALITGYAEYGLGEEALSCFQEMQHEGVYTDAITLLCSAKACGIVGAIDHGREIHAEIIKSGFEKNPIVGCSLVDLYAKCGSLTEAHGIFNVLSTHDVFAWNILISAYAYQGQSEHVFHLFHRMTTEGVHPDSLTLLSLLNVCSHTGLIKEGQWYLEAISREYGISLTIAHHNCMVDLFCRAGLIKEAVAIAGLMPLHPDLVMWRTLMGACQQIGHIKLGGQAFSSGLKLDEKEHSLYILMSNIYAHGTMGGEETNCEISVIAQ